MTKLEIVSLIYLVNDDQLDDAIKYIDDHFRSGGSMEDPALIKLTDLVWEYEERTDILNRNHRI